MQVISKCLQYVSYKAFQKPEQTINRQVLISLLFAQASAVLINAAILPLWLFAVAVVIFIWRLQILRNQWRFPNFFVRTSLVVISIAAITLTYKQWYNLEPMVILLTLSFLLKLLEVSNKRDAILLVFVGYFVVSCAFLFEQGIIISLLGAVVIWSLTACLLVLHSDHIRYLSTRSLRTITVLIAQAVPIMLIMLFVFPRVGALWSVPVKGDNTVTGVSDSMSPGDFSNLTRSRKLAFRVSFDDNKVPEPSQRYWRGLVFTEFDGRRWERASKGSNLYFGQKGDETRYSSNTQDSTNIYNYEVVLEPTNSPWIYGLPLATVNDKELERTATNELWLKDPATSRIKYRASSSFDFQVTEQKARLAQALVLPEGFNLKTIAQAKQWRSEVATDAAYISKVMDFYNKSFTYTLSPPKLGENTIDEFLFSTQSGFCEHYSSSFVVLMRAAGIPARVVTGYQGGEWNAEDNYLLVRQYDAHAWAEVWLEGQGWVRFDPTAAVAPNRIEAGLFDTLSQDDQDLIDSSGLPSFAWINNLALKWDSLNFRWQRWVLSYDQEEQSKFLETLLGKITPVRLALLLIVPAMFMLFVFGFLTLRNSRKPVSLELKLYTLLTKKLKRKGVSVGKGDTLSEIFARAYKAVPEAKTSLQAIENDFTAILYSNQQSFTKDKYNNIKRSIRAF